MCLSPLTRVVIELYVSGGSQNLLCRVVDKNLFFGWWTELLVSNGGGQNSKCLVVDKTPRVG